MSTIDLYPNDLRMPKAKEARGNSEGIIPVHSTIYLSSSYQGLLNRPYLLNFRELVEYTLSGYNYGIFLDGSIYDMYIEKNNYYNSQSSLDIYYSSYCLAGIYNYSDYDHIMCVPSIYEPFYLSYSDINSIDYMYGNYSGYFSGFFYNTNAYYNFCAYVPLSLNLDYYNSRANIKYMCFDITLDDGIEVNRETIISYDKLFELLKPKILEKYSSLFGGDINLYSSRLFDFYSGTEQDFSNLINNKQPAINKQKLFIESSLIDLPFYNYCSTDSSGLNKKGELTYYSMLNYSNFSPLRRYADRGYSSYVSVPMYSVNQFTFGKGYIEVDYTIEQDPSYLAHAIYKLDQSGVHILVNNIGNFKFKLSIVSGYYYPHNSTNSEEPIDVDIVISYNANNDFEPEEKTYNSNIFEKKIIDFKDYYNSSASVLTIVSDNPELIINNLGNGVFEFTANKSGTYTASQYVNGKLKSNKIIISANSILVDKTINANYFCNIKISIDEICPGIPENIDVELEYNSNYLEINKENRILYVKPISDNYGTINIVYRVNEKDSATITLKLSSVNIENITSSFMIIDKNKNRRIYSDFEDYKKYFSKIVNNEIFMINKIEDILDYQELYKGSIVINNIEDLKIVVENNKFKIKNINNTIYSSEEANGKSIFIKINNVIKVLYFDKLLYNSYYSKKEYDKLKSYYKSLKFIDFDEVFTEILTYDISANNQYDITIFYINNKNKIQMWKFAQYETESIISFYDSKSFNINGVEDSINKLGCSFYKEDGIFGLYSNRDDLINSIDIELKTGNSNPYNLSEMKNNGNKLIVANSENHKAVYSKILEKNKKYSLTNLKKPSDFKITTYDKDDNKIGEFNIKSNGYGDYKITNSILTDKNDIEEIDTIYQIISNGSDILYPFEVDNNIIRSKIFSPETIVIRKSENVTDVLIEKIPNSRLNISEIDRQGDKIFLSIEPSDSNSDIVEIFKLKCFDYEISIDVEFRNIDYKYKPANKSELQTLLFNTIPKPNLWEIDTSLITDMSSLFAGKVNYEFFGIEYWDVSKVANMQQMFQNCTNFDQPLNNWDTSSVTNMSYMFSGCNNFNQPLNNWDTSSVINMQYMFQNCNNFNQPLNNWDTSSVTNMNSMFYNCSNFNQDINSWNVSSVTDINQFLYNCTKFNQPLNNWNVSNVTNMNYMFQNCTNFNQDISSWDTSKVNNMYGMFYNCNNFNRPLNNWNTSKVTVMSYMFQNCTNFNQPLNNWNVSNVTSMNCMFYNCSNFNQDINSWIVSSVTDMSYMFYNCTNFNQDISSWDIKNVTNYANIFVNCSIKTIFKPDKFR